MSQNNGYNGYNGYAAQNGYAAHAAPRHVAPQQAGPSPTREFEMKPKRKGRRVLVGILVLLLVAVAVVAAVFFAYMGKLDAALALEPDKKDAIESMLVEPTPGQPYYALLIGSDGREGVEGSDAQWAGQDGSYEDQRSDVMILARIDEQGKQVTLLSIPRDTAYQFPDGSWGKMNYAYTAGGVPQCIQAVANLTGAPISHVVEIHMSGMMGLVDAVGGITVDVEIPIDYHEALTFEDVHLDPGEQRLTGAQAEVYARERMAYRGMYDYPDMHRQSVVRIIVEAIMAEAKQKPVTELPGLILEGAECVETDYTSWELLQTLIHLGRDFTLYQGTGPYEGGINDNVQGQWLTYQNPDGWDRVMTIVDAGGDPSTVSYEGDEVTEVVPE